MVCSFVATWAGGSSFSFLFACFKLAVRELLMVTGLMLVAVSVTSSPCQRSHAIASLGTKIQTGKDLQTLGSRHSMSLLGAVIHIFVRERLPVFNVKPFSTFQMLIVKLTRKLIQIQGAQLCMTCVVHRDCIKLTGAM